MDGGKITDSAMFCLLRPVTKRKRSQVRNVPAAPTLGPAQPLTLAFVESLMRSLGGGVQADVLPANILAKADRMIVWWTPARRRQMFYESSEGKAAELSGCIFPQPPLVWRVSNGELNVRALTENKRPAGSSKLAVAPFWNLSDDGRVCTGTMRRPDSASVGAIPAWERGFYAASGQLPFLAAPHG
jgi:PRTRC genetic system protein B